MIRNRSWGDVYVSAVVRGETCTRAAWLADAWERRRHREAVAWQGPPQRHRKRGRRPHLPHIMGPLAPDQWDAASTREGLIAQLRGQREANTLIPTELGECREENARLRELLRYVWWQTSGDKLRDRIGGEAMLRCYLRADIMRQVAALFVEEKDG